MKLTVFAKLTVAILWLVPSSLASSKCVRNTAQINKAEAEVEDIYVHSTRTYILCPNTIYEMSDKYNFATGRASDGKQHPLVLFNPNVKILCGKDGKVENTCILNGGDVQVFIASCLVLQDLGNTDLKKDRFLSDIEISGISFGGSSYTNVVVASPGNVVFNNCNFFENTGESAIVIADYFAVLSKSREQRRRLGGKVHKPKPKPKPKEEPKVNPIKVTLFQCCFLSNRVALPAKAKKAKLLAGIVTAIGPKRAPTQVTINENIFQGNRFAASLADHQFTSMILNIYGEMTVIKTCFIDNSVSMGLLVNNRGTLSLRNNNERRTDAGDIGCAGLITITTGDLFTGAIMKLNSRCTPLESRQCLATHQCKLPMLAPTGQPSVLPTMEPTHEPTLEPTFVPSNEPTLEPTNEPTHEPSFEPTFEPTSEPTFEPTFMPTSEPTNEPTSEPTNEPTNEPTSEPTFGPTEEPTENPSVAPTPLPTPDPTPFPTEEPTFFPTDEPSTPPCEDTKGSFGTRVLTKEKRDCEWLRQMPSRPAFYCESVNRAKNGCLKTCDNCPERSRNNRRRDDKKYHDKKYHPCVDDPYVTFPYYKHVPQSCKWLQRNAQRIKDFCVKGSRAERVCPMTCGAC